VGLLESREIVFSDLHVFTVRINWITDPWKGVCGGAEIFDSALLQPAHSVCVSLSAFFSSNETKTSSYSITSVS